MSHSILTALFCRLLAEVSPFHQNDLLLIFNLIYLSDSHSIVKQLALFYLEDFSSITKLQLCAIFYWQIITSQHNSVKININWQETRIWATSIRLWQSTLIPTTLVCPTNQVVNTTECQFLFWTISYKARLRLNTGKLWEKYIQSLSVPLVCLRAVPLPFSSQIGQTQ